MIKFRATGDDGRVVYGLGITERNVELLQAEKPIVVRLDELGLDRPVDVMIFYGKDERTIHRQLKQGGFIGKETELRVDPGAPKEYR